MTERYHPCCLLTNVAVRFSLAEARWQLIDEQNLSASPGVSSGGVSAVAGTQESFLLQGLLWLGSCLSLWWLCRAVGWHPSFCPELVGLGHELSLCFWPWVHGHVTLLQPLAGTSGQGCLHGLRVALPSPLSPELQHCSGPRNHQSLVGL